MTLSPYETRKLAHPDLTQNDIEYFKKRYGNRFVKALRAVEEGRVFKYNFKPSSSVTWIVKGINREYLVIPEVYCTCRSFYQSAVIAREIRMCYHILAQRIAEIRQQYKTNQSTDAERRNFYKEWRRTD